MQWPPLWSNGRRAYQYHLWGRQRARVIFGIVKATKEGMLWNQLGNRSLIREYRFKRQRNKHQSFIVVSLYISSIIINIRDIQQ